MAEQADILKEIADSYGFKVIAILLRDRTTKKNILWAVDDYAWLGEGYLADCEMTPEGIFTNRGNRIRPRVRKQQEDQSSRTRGRAEVFTPLWVCNEQNNLIDARWFGRRDVFNQSVGKSWEIREGPVSFPGGKGRTWKNYVDARRLEITCGEAPYLASRYDPVTGEQIPVERRIGMLDRKLRAAGENTDSEEEWIFWARRAFESVYGYEYQGDSLFLARGNLLGTYVEYMEARWKRKPSGQELARIATIISWNLWQMDGQAFTVPAPGRKISEKPGAQAETPFCRIKDWRAKEILEYRSLMKKGL